PAPAWRARATGRSDRAYAQRSRLALDEQGGIAKRGATEIHQQRHRAVLLKLAKPRVGDKRAWILDHLGPGVGHRLGVIAGLLRGIAAVGIDIEADLVADRRADLAHAGTIHVEALAAFDLEGTKAVLHHHRGRLSGHRLRRLAGERPGQLDPARAAPALPQG